MIGRYLEGEILGLVRPDGGHTEDELLLAHVKVVAHGGRLDLAQSMLVDGADEVGSNVEGVLGKCLPILFEAAIGEKNGLCLVGVKQQLNSMDGRITPINLTTPLELGEVLLIVQDESWHFGLAKTLEA